MASQTKGRESWTEEESTRTTIRQSSPLKLSRVFRFVDQQTGAPQISDFPDSNPTGDTPLEIRMKHFTEIENFTFLAYTLSHELGGTTPRPIRTDRKSTRLNSSHSQISYAVFCLKKK